MYKTITTLLLSAGMISHSQANSFDDAIKHGTNTGLIRFGYISQAPDVAGNPTTTAASIGGQVKYETAVWNRVQFAISPYFSERLANLSGDKASGELNTDFFDANGDSFAYLGEAYINYKWSNGSARIGRQLIETPFINTDQIRHFPNTYSAVWFRVELSKTLNLETGLVSTWAGYDSGPNQYVFKKAGVDGVTALGLSYNKSDTISAQGWYYDFSKQYTQLYADVSYTKGAWEVAGQFTSYSEKNASNTDGSVIGASLKYTTGPVTLGAALNSGANPSGKSASFGLGGGSSYTSMDESTINGLNDAQARVLSVGYAATPKFVVTLALGHFEDSSKTTNTDETDLILKYSTSDKLSLELIHAVVDNNGNPTDAITNFTRQLARMSYTF